MVKYLKKLILTAAVVCTALLMPVTAQAATTWTVMPAQGLEGVTLNAVSCSSTSFCLAFGINGPQPLVFEWNGTTWSGTAVPDGATAINSLSCVSATYCIAVGYSFFNGTQTAAWLWNGSGWSEQAAFNPATKWNYLKAVKCLSATDCEAVGLAGTHEGFDHHPLAEVWNGTTWTGQAIQGTVSGELDAIACTAAASCEAVGTRPAASGKTAGLALRWKGTAWVSQKLPVLAGGSRLSGVSCYLAGCTAVGSTPSSGGGQSTLAEAWNGSRWALQSPPGSGNVKGAIYTIWSAVHCQSAINCTVAGTWFPAAGGNLTLAETWNGSAWVKNSTPTPDPSGGEFEAMSCTGGGRVCTAVGSSGGSGLAERN